MSDVGHNIKVIYSHKKKITEEYWNILLIVRKVFCYIILDTGQYMGHI